MSKKIKCRTYDNKTVELDVSELSFRPSVYGVVIKGDKVLLARQWDGYDIPGGSIDIDEWMEDALVREVEEETGIIVRPIRAIHAQDDFFIHPRTKKPYHTPLICFYCEYVSGDLNIDGLDDYEKKYMNMPQWVPIEKIEGLKFYNPIDSPMVIKRD